MLQIPWQHVPRLGVFISNNGYDLSLSFSLIAQSKAPLEKIIGQMYSFILDLMSSRMNNGIYVMTPEESEAVKAGIDDIENGRFITHEEANK